MSRRSTLHNQAPRSSETGRDSKTTRGNGDDSERVLMEESVPEVHEGKNNNDEHAEAAGEDEIGDPEPRQREFLMPRELLANAKMVKLTLYEKKEVRNYSEIYFYGQECEKVYKEPHNHGFDSEDRTYCAAMRDHVAYRYEILRQVGKGHSARVYKAYDHKTKTVVALKIFRNDGKCRGLAKKEESILRLLNDMEPPEREENSQQSANIVQMYDAFVFRKHHVIVLELLSGNLFDHILDTKYRPHPVDQVRALARSILRALLLLVKARIIHGDLKPENLALRSPGKTGIKVIDFGTSLLETDTDRHTYFQSRYYRAPEVILGLPYSFPIDMWSFGCILAEVALGPPLFGGGDEQVVLARIVECLGMPPASMREQCQETTLRALAASAKSKNVFAMHFTEDGSAKYSAESVQLADDRLVGPPGSRPLRGLFGEDQQHDDFVDFLGGCLTWDPVSRMTPMQAAVHPWLRVVNRSSSSGSQP